MTSAEVEVGHDQAGEIDEAAPHEVQGGVHYTSYDPYQQEEEAAPPKKSLLVPVAVLLVALVAAGGAADFFFFKNSSGSAQTFQDLGAGISNATGLRGSLQVRWEKNQAQYQIKFEPIDPLQTNGFVYVLSNPPAPMTLKIRILDATGFALCNKEIAFPFSGGTPGGMDVFQNTVSSEGKVTDFAAQGLLPCTEDQFRQASYWDFNTNFPTLAEQDAMLKSVAAEKARKAAAQRAIERRSGAGFTAEGYDAVIGYDSTRNAIESRLGRVFSVTRAADRTMATNWANSSALFHYKCDQHARCSLTHSGGGTTIFVVALQ